MKSNSRFLSFINIEPGEGRLVALMLVQSFFIGSARIFTRTSAYALFLAEFDATSLPYIYIGIGVIVTLLSFSYLKLSERISFSKLLIANVAFLVVSLLFFRLSLNLTTSKWLVFVLPVWYEVLWTLTNLEFWNLAGRIFNLRQGKRLFGLIGAGEQAATIIGGLLVPVIVGLTGTANLLLVAAGSMAGVLALLLYICSSNSDRLAVPAARTGNRKQKSSLTLFKNHYILAIFGLFALMIVTYFTVDNIFYAQTQVQFPTEDQLAGFIGVFFGICGFLSLLSRTFLTGLLLNRFGVRIALMVTPLLLFVSGAAAAAIGTVFGVIIAFFWLVVFMRVIEMVFFLSVDLPTVNILYQPLPAAQRVSTQAMVEGIIYSLSIGLTGVVLSILNSLVKMTTIQLVYAVVVIVLVWTFMAVLMGRLYPRALVRALTKRRLDSAGLTFDEAQSIQILQRELQSPHAGAVIYAMHMLDDLKPGILTASLPALLDHPDPAVRQEVLKRMERLCLTSATSAILLRLAREDAPLVRGTAMCTLAALGGKQAMDTVSAAMDDPAPQVRRGAMVGLLRNSGIEGAQGAGTRLLKLANSPDPLERVFACQVLGEVGIHGFYQPLLPLLLDEALPVRRAALQAAGQIKNPRLWPEVMEGLRFRPVRSAAISALVNGGAEVLPELSLAYSAAGQDQSALVEACGRIGGHGAIAWLKDRLGEPNMYLRTQVLRSLSRCGFHARQEEFALIRKQIETEAAQAVGHVAWLTDLDECDSTHLLRDALEHILAQDVERIFFLLSFIYDTPTILGARDNLALAAADRRAYAIEILDVSLGQDFKKWLFPLLSNQSPRQKFQQLKVYFPQVQQDCPQRLRGIITGSANDITPWMRACALYTVGRMHLGELSETVAGALEEPASFVKETAAWTLAKLSGNGDKLKDAGQPSLSSQPVGPVPTNLEKPRSRSPIMLTTIEKVIALKKVGIFSATPDETLVDIAALLEEVDVEAGETIIEKGDLGDCMYIIVDGDVRVHDGESTLNHLAAGDVFGEMAVLDSEPRVASVTAVVATSLLRLAQEPLFALTDEQPEVARRIIRVLSRHLRARIQDMNELRKQLEHTKL